MAGKGAPRPAPTHTPANPLFPYTTLFRSVAGEHDERARRSGTRALRGRPADDGHLRGENRRDDLAHRGARKSTRLNSSHMSISYAVLCLKKKTSTGRALRCA